MSSRVTPGMFSNDDIKDIESLNEKLSALDTEVLRALIRQSAHHVDKGIQCYDLRPEENRRKPEIARAVLRASLYIYSKKGCNVKKSDIIYAYDALKRGDAFDKKLIYQPLSPHEALKEDGQRLVERIMQDRRSIRRFNKKEVPDGLVDKIIKAGSWAPNSCSLQACRFIVIKDVELKSLLNQPWIAPVIVLGCFDERPYEFIKGNELPYNPHLDLGSAIQNMSLMAHSLGLGTCIGTFSGEIGTLRCELKVPDYIQIITYLVLGWPDDNPSRVPRMDVEEFILMRR